VFADGLIYLMSIGRRRAGNVVPRWCHVGICHREYTNISIVKLNLLYTILEVIYDSIYDAAEMDQPHACMQGDRCLLSPGKYVPRNNSPIPGDGYAG
jgi:hypothetical protein